MILPNSCDKYDNDSSRWPTVVNDDGAYQQMDSGGCEW